MALLKIFQTGWLAVYQTDSPNRRIALVLQLICRLVLGWVFLESGWEKQHHLEAFYRAAQNYHMLTPELTRLYATALPWVEMLAGGYLVLGLFTRYAALLIALMLVSFIIAIIKVLITGEAADCGCFVGGKSDPVDIWLLLRDIGFLLMAVWLWLNHTFPFSVDSLMSQSEKESTKNT